MKPRCICNDFTDIIIKYHPNEVALRREPRKSPNHKGLTMKYVLGHLRRADEDFNMIDSEKTIAVGVSGGKDSMVLLYALHLYQHFSRHTFRITAVTVDLGFGGFDVPAIADYCASLGITHTCVKTNIAKIVFENPAGAQPVRAVCQNEEGGFIYRDPATGYQHVRICAPSRRLPRIAAALKYAV